MFKRSLLTAVFSMISLSALAGLPTNVANEGKAYAGSIPPQGIANVFDGNSLSQIDFAHYVAIIWDEARTLDRVIMEQCPGYVVPSYAIQVAKAGVTNPDPTTNDDWYTVATFTGIAANSAPSFAFDVDWATTGVRFVVDDVGTLGNGRMREIWAFENYTNVAPLATFSAPGWSPGASFNDETTTIQVHSQADPIATGRQYVYATFDELVTLDASCIVGGSSNAAELLIDYKIWFWDYTLGDDGDWAVALSVVGNTARTDWRDFDVAGTSDQWRLEVIKATGSGTNPDNWARISEIMLFAPIPEPATMTLLALGGLALLRRRR